MKIEILNDVTINTGAPCPKIISSETNLSLIYYYDDGMLGPTDTPKSRNPISDLGISIIRFDFPLIYKMGAPGEETFDNHPLYKFGLEHYKGHLIHESSWINELIKIDSVHPMHDPKSFEELKHYLFAFHDTTFECIAKGYKLHHKNLGMYDLLVSEVQNIFINEY